MKRFDWIAAGGTWTGAAIGVASAYILALGKFTGVEIEVSELVLREGTSAFDAYTAQDFGVSWMAKSGTPFTDWILLLLSTAVGLAIGAYLGLLAVAALRAVNRANRSV